jgi:hypothetical protein
VSDTATNLDYLDAQQLREMVQSLIVVGNTAVLVVASGRNSAVAMGTAKLANGELRWRLVEEISPGSPEGDSPLILGSATLARAR